MINEIPAHENGAGAVHIGTREDCDQCRRIDPWVIEAQGLAAYLATVTGDPVGAWVAAIKAAHAAGVTLDAVSAWASRNLAAGHALSPAHLGSMISAVSKVGGAGVRQPVSRHGIQVKPGQIRDMVDGHRKTE